MGSGGTQRAEPSSNVSVDDAELLDAFRTCTLPYHEWCHRLHVRLAYLFLARHPFEEALRTFRGLLQSYNLAQDVPESLTSGYHETLTVGWLRLIAARMPVPPASTDSESFCASNPDLLDKSLLRGYYSAARLVSWNAKRQFVPPDLQPLPGRDAA